MLIGITKDLTNGMGRAVLKGRTPLKNHWGSEVLWINPPFNMFPRVLDKIVQDEAHAVILVPKWRKHKFFWRAWGLAVDAVMVPKGTVLFERKGKVQKGVPWDVYAFLVCGHVPPCPLCEVRGLPTPSVPPFE